MKQLKGSKMSSENEQDGLKVGSETSLKCKVKRGASH